MRAVRCVLWIAGLWLIALSTHAADYQKYSEQALKEELNRLSTIQRQVMVPMRDGVRLATDLYLPKNTKGPVPLVLVKQPYSFAKLPPEGLQLILEAVSRGYAFAFQYERGRYFSEGEWKLLGLPRTDGYDALTWFAKQPWSNGKIGTWGCSSSAEWQLALAAEHHPAHAAMVAGAAAAGIGTAGVFHEQGGFFTGGVPRVFYATWLYRVDNPQRAQLPPDLDDTYRARVAGYNDLVATKPAVDWPTWIKHLPVSGLSKDLGEPPGTFDELIRRGPADPAWRENGLYHDDEGWGVPTLWLNSWYDHSIGPNLALFNHARTVNSNRDASANQYAIVAPTEHCKLFNLGPRTVVGERDMGDTTLDVWAETYAFFDRFLKGEARAYPASTPRIRYFTMGVNRWSSDEQWPPRDARNVRFYLRSSGRANSLHGDGRLTTEAPAPGEPADRFVYDPMNPVQSIGGGDCCTSGLTRGGAYDQRIIEARTDVLVYTSDPLREPLEVSGFIQPLLKVSSSAPDTDFAVKLVDVAPDGTAYILADTIFRARYREGYDREVLMKPGEIYTLQPTPMSTSVTFLEGHSIRIEVTSSNFPKYFRNLNIAGDSSQSKEWAIATNTVHHEPGAASYIDLPIITRKRSAR